MTNYHIFKKPTYDYAQFKDSVYLRTVPKSIIVARELNLPFHYIGCTGPRVIDIVQYFHKEARVANYNNLMSFNTIETTPATFREMKESVNNSRYKDQISVNRGDIVNYVHNLAWCRDLQDTMVYLDLDLMSCYTRELADKIVYIGRNLSKTMMVRLNATYGRLGGTKAQAIMIKESIIKGLDPYYDWISQHDECKYTSKMNGSGNMGFIGIYGCRKK